MINNAQETGVSGLYVSDCSVFTESPGRPSMLNIAVLSKHLAKRLAEEHL